MTVASASPATATTALLRQNLMSGSLSSSRCCEETDARERWSEERKKESADAEVAGDEHPLHLAGALADLQDLRVAVEPADRELVHEAVAAVHLRRGAR